MNLIDRLAARLLPWRRRAARAALAALEAEKAQLLAALAAAEQRAAEQKAASEFQMERALMIAVAWRLARLPDRLLPHMIRDESFSAADLPELLVRAKSDESNSG